MKQSDGLSFGRSCTDIVPTNVEYAALSLLDHEFDDRSAGEYGSQ